MLQHFIIGTWKDYSGSVCAYSNKFILVEAQDEGQLKRPNSQLLLNDVVLNAIDPYIHTYIHIVSALDT